MSSATGEGAGAGVGGDTEVDRTPLVGGGQGGYGSNSSSGSGNSNGGGVKVGAGGSSPRAPCSRNADWRLVFVIAGVIFGVAAVGVVAFLVVGAVRTGRCSAHTDAVECAQDWINSCQACFDTAGKLTCLREDSTTAQNWPCASPYFDDTCCAAPGKPSELCHQLGAATGNDPTLCEAAAFSDNITCTICKADSACFETVQC